MHLILRSFLTLLLLPGLISCNGRSASENKIRAQQPNIVLILADDQAWGDLSFNGNTNLNTPNIDAIAQNGVSFENFYVQPVCSPTRAELLTGRYFPRLGVYSTSAGGERFNLGETTLAEIFKKAGYKTAVYGKWHSGMQPPYHPNARGFDDFYGFASGHWGNYFSPMLEHNGKIVKGTGFLVDDLTNRGIDFISENKNKPFFLYLPFNTPHSPMQVPDKFWDPFEGKELMMRYKDSTQENINFTKAALAMVENIDYNVGRITSKLKELSLEENTIIIYLSDNGPNGWRWNGGMRGRKGSVDEGGVKVPFFIQWKDELSAGKKVTKIASAIDILPTLAALAGVKSETKHPLDGVDLSPLLFGESANWQNRIVYNHWRGHTSIRSQDYRLDNGNKLYNMALDPGQLNDLSKEQPRILDSLIGMKDAWLSSIVSENIEEKTKSFPIGDIQLGFTQLPARDGVAHGNIKRSSKYPNDSYFTNWKSVQDSISWKVEVLNQGTFEVILYYSCAPVNIGTNIQLIFGDQQLTKEITVAHDPPLTGMENDRDPRIESYIKDFKPLSMGTIYLQKGEGKLRLKAKKIVADKAIEVRLLLFNRLD